MKAYEVAEQWITKVIREWFMHISIEVKRPNVYDLHEDKIKERIKTNPNLCPNSLKQLQSQN